MCEAHWTFRAAPNDRADIITPSGHYAFINVSADDATAIVERLNAYRTEVARLEAENAKLRDGGWQRIDTAPKDGTVVLLFASIWGDTHGEVQVGYFDFETRQWHAGEMSLDDNELGFDPDLEIFDDEDEDAFLDETERNVGPTHWMPLPKGPQS